jgi:biotin carboxyl carrier protein
MLSVERREAVGITTVDVGKRAVARTLRLPSVIEAPEKATSEVRVRTPGFVERVAAVETGQRVEAGAPLVWLYSPEIMRAEEELLAARRMVAPAAAAGAPPPSGHQLDAQMSEAARQRLVLLGVHEVDVARIIESGKAERLVPVRAPAAGIVTERRVSVGTYATPEMMLFRVTDLSKLWASATVASEDLAAITPGVKGRFVARGGDRSYDVAAALVEPEVSTATRAGRVRFVASNKDALLRPGDIGEVLVDLAEQPFVVVPRDAVIDVGNARYVYVEKSPGTFSPQIVELGPLIGEERAITRGLELGARIVARGAFLLDSESRLGAALAPGAPSSTREGNEAAPSHGGHDHGGTR